MISVTALRLFSTTLSIKMKMRHTFYFYKLGRAQNLKASNRDHFDHYARHWT